MVKFHDSHFAHDYPFATVTLAYFLRYPNPLAVHVLSTDVIDRYYDPETSRLYTARLHLKRSKIPSAVLNLLPRSWLGKDVDSGTSQSYILERSVVDMKEGVMITESRNLEFTGILAVLERQVYRRPDVDLQRYWAQLQPSPWPGFAAMQADAASKFRWKKNNNEASDGKDADSFTEVSTKVELYSKLGEKKFLRRKPKGGGAAAAAAQQPNSTEDALTACPQEEEQQAPKAGFFRSWGLGPIQRSIEAIGLRRTERAVPNSKKGMNIVLERLRSGGLVAVLEGMRKDREMALVGGGGGFKGGSYPPPEEE